MTSIRGVNIVFVFVLLASPSYAAPDDAGQSSSSGAQCPNQVGHCASFGQNRLVCLEQKGQNLCSAPLGANLCLDGQACPVGTVCGSIGQFAPEDERHSFPCYRGGPVVVYDGPAGGPCKSVDGLGVTHMCKSARCDANTPSMCLADPPLTIPRSPGG